MTPPQPITDLVLQFQYTEAEYVAAVHSYYNRTFHMRTYIIALSVVLLAGLYLWFSTGEAVMFFGVSVFLLIVATPLIFYFVTPRTVFRREPNFHNIYTLRFTEDGLEFKTENVNSKLDWKLYRQVWENKAFYLLFYGERLFTVIPKRVFESAAQERQFRELLQRHITPTFVEY
ncbi:MAG: YcxB family protein [Chloroflexi bacterium]|nr:YcxB family protein [Chloroflexota bacterium]